MGVKIDDENLNYLRFAFADDLVLIADRFDDAVEMLCRPNTVSQEGLRINISKHNT